MRNLSLALLLFSIATFAVAGGACREKLDSQYRLSGPEISLAELHRIGTAYAAQNDSVPQVPFAYSNNSWHLLVANYRPGDQIRAFEMLGPGGSIFVRGYALIRGQCVVTSILTAMS
jgi:hypothetical protein